MSEPNLENLSERERSCVKHLRQAQELGVSFAQYCRERGLKSNQWYWVKGGLVRKGVIAGRPQAAEDKPAGFVPVRIAPPAAAGTVCRIRPPSGWVIECGSFPDARWLSALMSGEAP
jgi:hypothetical protein